MKKRINNYVAKECPALSTELVGMLVYMRVLRIRGNGSRALDVHSWDEFRKKYNEIERDIIIDLATEHNNKLKKPSTKGEN